MSDIRPDAAVRSPAMDELRYAVAPITNVDVREDGGQGWWTMSGYAAVFNETTTLYDGKFFKLTEEIDTKFFDRVLREQPMTAPAGVVHFNRGHDMNTSVAATDVPAGQVGSLQLQADKNGLFFLAKVPHDDPDGVALAAKMRSGVVRQASFAFTIAADKIEIVEREEGPEIEHRTLLECKHLYDVCATPQGAYSQTVAGLRSLAAALGQPVSGDQTRQPSGWSIDAAGVIIPTPTASNTTESSTSSAPSGDEQAEKKLASAEAREAFQREIERRKLVRSGYPSRKGK